MTKRFNYVILSQQSWGTEIGSNAKNIAMEISKDNKVLYVNRPLDILTRMKNFQTGTKKSAKKKRGEKAGIDSQIEQVSENLFAFTPNCTLLSINRLPEGSWYDMALRFNNYLLANEIKKAVSHLGLENYIFLNDGELFNGFHLNTMLDAQKNLYYYRDYFLAVPYWQKHGKRIEPEILAKYDAVVCNSEFLSDIAKQYNENSSFVGQGCDYTLFKEALEIPSEAVSNEKPVIGYVGALNSQRLDVQLLEKLTARNKQWHWVFVGPEDPAFQSSSMHDLDNVTFTGSKPQEELASYIRSFDVAINPQRVNEVTIGNYPRKIDEYLFMGKPTVATKTRAMEMFADHCYLTSGVKGYQSAIKEALASNSPHLATKRIEFASMHSWKNSVDKIYQALAS